MKKLVVENLKDRESARFYGDIIYSDARDRACVEYNAKNSFGGYGNSSKAELKKVKGEWTLVSMDSSCSKQTFDEDAKLAKDAAAAQALQEERLKERTRLRKVCPQCKTIEELVAEVEKVGEEWHGGQDISVKTEIWPERERVFNSLLNGRNPTGGCKKTKLVYGVSYSYATKYKAWDQARRLQELFWKNIDNRFRDMFWDEHKLMIYNPGASASISGFTSKEYNDDFDKIINGLRSGLCLADSDSSFGNYIYNKKIDNRYYFMHDN